MDGIVEESETFRLSFTIPSLLSGKVTPGNITSATGAITDDTSKIDIEWTGYLANVPNCVFSN